MMMMTLLSKLFRTGSTLGAILLTVACAPVRGFGAFLILNPAYMKGEINMPGPLAKTIGDVNALKKVDSIDSMRLAERKREVPRLRFAIPASMASSERGDFRSTWATAEKDDGMGVTLGESLSKELLLGRFSFATVSDESSPKWGDLFWLNNQVSFDLRETEHHVD
jgi:hypothetical protein